MEPIERREWERIAYGRDSTNDERADALRLLDESSTVVQSDEVSSPRLAPMRRRALPWVIAVGSILVAAVAVVPVAVPRAPVGPPPVRSLALSPAREADLPGGDPADPDVLDPNELLGIESLVAPDTITTVTDLGTGDGGATAWGVLSSGQQICVVLREGSMASPRCTTLADFRDNGIDVDRGFWGIIWNADGTVTWYDN